MSPRANANRVRLMVMVLVLVLIAGSLVVASAMESDPFGDLDGIAQRNPTPTPTATEGPFYPPLGEWRPVHGPRQDPLWRNPPVLRGVHGRLGDDGKWSGWAVGDDGVIARYDGNEWSTIDDFDPRSTGAITYSFRDVFVQSEDSVWIVGSTTGERGCEGCGVIVKWDGRRFVTLDRWDFRVNGRMGGLNAIDMLQDAEGSWWGWIVGDDADFDRFKAMFIRYTPEVEWRVWPVSNIARDLYDVKILAHDEAWAVGGIGIETWYNEKDQPGQGIWRAPGLSSADDLFAVDLPDPLRGWSAGNRGMTHKYVGHCHDDDDTTQCWFDNKGILVYNEDGRPWANDIHALTMISRTEGWLVGAVNGRRSTIANYADENRWELVQLDDDPGKDLYAMVMLTPDYGWAVGDDGVIMEYSAVATRTPPVPDTATPTPTDLTSATPTSSSTPDLPSPTMTPSATDMPTGTRTATPDGSATATVDRTVTATPTGEATIIPSATMIGDTLTPPPPAGTLYLPAVSQGW